MFTKVKKPHEIDAMRESGKMLATVLALLKKEISAGMTTKDLADIAKKELRTLGGQPTFLGYYGFPDVICISVNDEVVHGIPNPDKTIKKGDIVGLDFGVTYKGMITDAAVSVVVDEPIAPRTKELLNTTERSLEAGIQVVCDGVRVGDIGNAIQKILDAHHLGIVRDLVGHGVGHQLHEDPNIPNYGHRGIGPQLHAGMTIAIEPMATLGTHKVYIADDGWTVFTIDHSLSAHFEHTVLITEDGAEILTLL